MDVFEAIRTVLAVRQYQDMPVSQDVVRRIVEAGRLTGSASNQQPWHFVVVQDKDKLQKIGELAQTGPYIAGAPLAVVVAVARNAFALSDGSRAIQSMMLAAWEEGVGSNWVGFSGRLDEVGKLLGIPADLDVLAIIPFGYPVTKLGMGKKKRKPLNEVASLEKYGTPFQ